VTWPPTPTSPLLGQPTEVCLVGDRDRGIGSDRLREAVSERLIGPSKVRGKPDETVGAANNSGYGNTDSDQPVVGQWREQRAGEVGEVGNDLLDRHVRARPIDPDELADGAAEADSSSGNRVNVDLECKDRDAIGVRMHER
jgi:hypothetical protein